MLPRCRKPASIVHLCWCFFVVFCNFRFAPPLGTQHVRLLQQWRGSVYWRSQGSLTPPAVEKDSLMLKSLINQHNRRYVPHDNSAQLLHIKQLAYKSKYFTTQTFVTRFIFLGWSRAPTSKEDCNRDWRWSETSVPQKCQTVAPKVWGSWGRGMTLTVYQPNKQNWLFRIVRSNMNAFT